MRIIKMLLEKLIFRNDADMKEQLLRCSVLLSVIFSSFTAISGVFSGLPIEGMVPVLAVTTTAIVSFLLIAKWKKVVLAACLMGLITNLLLLPNVLFSSANGDFGVVAWFVYGFVYAFMLFEGKLLALFVSLTTVVTMVTFFIKENYPAIANAIATQQEANGGSYMTIVIVGLQIGLLIKLQKRGYDRQRAKAEEQAAITESISRSKSAFFANMSHEIRTPINTIIGLNEMTLRENNISDEVAENAVNIQRASKMLLSLINDILDLSKLESGKMEIVPVQYETGTMLSDIVNIMWIRAHEKKLDFKIDIDPEIPSMLYGDDVRLKQVLMNLLTNAIKYTEKGAVTLSVKAEQSDANKVLLKISVADTGIGIKKEDLEELFASFKRVDEESNHNIEGTGLGLSIAKQLIEMMGGQITIDSIYKKGSTFTVLVEQYVMSPNPIGEMDFLMRMRLNEREKYKQSFEAPDAKVLIVDDNDMNLMVVTKLLRDTKIQIDTAKSGKECLEKTLSNSYHVIFMDHVMPDMDGEETLERIQKQENGRCKMTPVIALTANVMAGAEERYKEKGFEGYLAKPINTTLLEATLLKYLPVDLIEYSASTIEEEKLDAAIQKVTAKKRKKLVITTDCVCDLPEEWLERFGIDTMHYYVHTKNGRFCDVKEIGCDNLMQYITEEENRAWSSSAPVEEYETFFANALTKAERIIHISMSSYVSDGYKNAISAARGFDNVMVVDSGHLSSGMGIMVLHAAVMVKDGYEVKKICTELERMKERISTSFVVPKTDSLYRNGRVSKEMKKLCDVVGLRPILHLNQGSLKLRGMRIGSIENVRKQYIRHRLAAKKKIDNRLLFITYAGCTVKELEEIKKEVERCMKFERIIFQKASATISCNCGVGAFGLLYMRKRQKRDILLSIDQET